MKRLVTWGVVAAIMLAAGVRVARAQAAGDAEAAEPGTTSPTATEEERARAAGFSHKGQVGVHIAGGIGYRGIFTYDEEYCGELKDDGGNRSPCLGRSPFGLDVGLGYGVARTLELFVEMRFGLEKDFGPAPNMSGPRPRAFSPGIKLYLGDLGPTTKFFSTLQLPIDFTDHEQLDKNDFGIRNINGLQLDVHHTFGIFLYFGEQVSWRRWLRFEVEGGLGAQVRFP